MFSAKEFIFFVDYNEFASIFETWILNVPFEVFSFSLLFIWLNVSFSSFSILAVILFKIEDYFIGD